MKLFGKSIPNKLNVINITEHNIFVSEIKPDDTKTVIENEFTFKLPDSQFNTKLSVINKIKKDIDTHIPVISIIPSNKIITRILKLPKVKSSEFENTVYWEIVRLTDNSPNKYFWHYIINSEFIEDGINKIEILLIIIPYKDIDELKNLFKTAGLNLIYIDIEQIAFHRLLSVYKLLNPDTNKLLINFKQDIIDIHIFKGNNLTFTRKVTIKNYNKLINLINNTDKDKKVFILPYHQTNEEPTDSQIETSNLIKQTFNELDIEINNTSAFFKNFYYSEKINNIIICGFKKKIHGLQDYLKKFNYSKFEILENFINVDNTTGFSEFNILNYSAGLSIFEDKKIDVTSIKEDKLKFHRQTSPYLLDFKIIIFLFLVLGILIIFPLYNLKILKNKHQQYNELLQTYSFSNKRLAKILHRTNSLAYDRVLINSIIKNRVEYSLILKELSKSVPTGIKLNSFESKKEKGSIVFFINGESVSQTLIPEIISNLNQTLIFDDIKLIKTKNIISEKETSVEFKIACIIKDKG